MPVMFLAIAISLFLPLPKKTVELVKALVCKLTL